MRGCRQLKFFLMKERDLATTVARDSPDMGWGLLRQFPPFRYFPNFSALPKHTLDIEYYVYIWQVSPQLSRGDTCQIWMWFKESNSYFCKIENFAYGEINERSFSNSHPWYWNIICSSPVWWQGFDLTHWRSGANKTMSRASRYVQWFLVYSQ